MAEIHCVCTQWYIVCVCVCVCVCVHVCTCVGITGNKKQIKPEVFRGHRHYLVLANWLFIPTYMCAHITITVVACVISIKRTSSWRSSLVLYPAYITPLASVGVWFHFLLKTSNALHVKGSTHSQPLTQLFVVAVPCLGTRLVNKWKFPKSIHCLDLTNMPVL